MRWYWLCCVDMLASRAHAAVPHACPVRWNKLLARGAWGITTIFYRKITAW